ncbi:MATH and LRR domain-containing protein PFE0570w [Hydra vulgaris]|uniref:MATH and LRR domain-containing protein PFE0570w n=1 Tax=Hydra vulgaris TaxID=6087 RepID=A0ABM4BST3_HYDVU
MIHFWLLLLHYLSAFVDCSLEEDVTEFYDVGGSPVHMIVSGSVLVSDELHDLDVQSIIPLNATVIEKHNKSFILNSTNEIPENYVSQAHGNDVAKANSNEPFEIQQKAVLKKAKKNTNKHVRKKKLRKNLKNKTSIKKIFKKYGYGKKKTKFSGNFYKNDNQAIEIEHAQQKYKLPTYEKISNDSEVSGMVRDEIPKKNDKDLLKTIYPPPSNMWKINKELTVTQKTLEEKGVLGEKRISDAKKAVSDQTDSIEAQLENEQNASFEDSVKIQTSSRPSLPVKINPKEKLQNNILSQKNQNDRFKIQTKIHGDEDQSAPLNKLHRSQEEKIFTDKNLSDKLLSKNNNQLQKQKSLSAKNIADNHMSKNNNKLGMHHTEVFYGKPPIMSQKPIIKTLNQFKAANENTKPNSLLNPSKHNSFIIENSFNAMYAPAEKQEVAQALDSSTVLSNNKLLKNEADTNNEEAAFERSGATKVENKPQEETLMTGSLVARAQENKVESTPNTGTKEALFHQQIDDGVQPGVQTEETVQQISNVESDSSQDSTEAQVLSTTTSDLPNKDVSGENLNSKEYEENVCDSCENLEDQTKVVNENKNITLQTDASEQAKQNVEKQTQNVAFEDQVKQNEELVKEQSETTPLNEAVQHLPDVVLYKSQNVNENVVSQTNSDEIPAKENEQYASARKNEDDEITITAETPQEARNHFEMFQNSTSNEKSSMNSNNINNLEEMSNNLITNSVSSQTTAPLKEESEQFHTQSFSAIIPNPSAIQDQLPDSSKFVNTDSKVLASSNVNQPQSEIRTDESDQENSNQNEIYKHQQDIAFMKNENQKAQEIFAREKEEKSNNLYTQNTEKHEYQSENNQVQTQPTNEKGYNNVGFAVNAEEIPFNNKVAFAQAKEKEQENLEASNKFSTSIAGDYSSLKQNSSVPHAEVESYVLPAYQSTSSESEPSIEVLTTNQQLRESSQPSFLKTETGGKNKDAYVNNLADDTQGELLSRNDLAKPVVKNTNYKNLQYSTPTNIVNVKTDQLIDPLNSTTLASTYSNNVQPLGSIKEQQYGTAGDFFLPAGVNPGAPMSSQMIDLWKLRGIAPQRGFLRGKIVNRKILKHIYSNPVQKTNAASKKKTSGIPIKHWSGMQQVPNNVMSVLKPKHPTGPSIAYQQTIPEEATNLYLNIKQKSIKKLDKNDKLDDNEGLEEKVSSSLAHKSPSQTPPGVSSPLSPAVPSPVSNEISPSSSPLSPALSPSTSNSVPSESSPATNSALSPGTHKAPGANSAAHHEQNKPQTSGYGFGSGSGHGYGERSFGWGGGGGWAGVPPPNGMPIPSYGPPPGMPDFPKIGQAVPPPAGSNPQLNQPLASSSQGSLSSNLVNKKPKLNPKIKVGYKSSLLTQNAKVNFKIGKNPKMRIPYKKKDDAFPYKKKDYTIAYKKKDNMFLNSVTLRKKR